MLSTCVRSPVTEMESSDITVMTCHALFQSVLGGPNAGPASDPAMDFVHQDGVSADATTGATFCGGGCSHKASP